MRGLESIALALARELPREAQLRLIAALASDIAEISEMHGGLSTHGEPSQGAGPQAEAPPAGTGSWMPAGQEGPFQRGEPGDVSAPHSDVVDYFDIPSQFRRPAHVPAQRETPEREKGSPEL